MEERIEILYVGNNTDFSFLVRSELEKSGFQLTVAENENQAWAMLLKEKILLLKLVVKSHLKRETLVCTLEVRSLLHFSMCFFI